MRTRKRMREERRVTNYAGKGVGITNRTGSACPSRCACNGTSRFIVMELEQAMDKAVEAVGFQ